MNIFNLKNVLNPNQKDISSITPPVPAEQSYYSNFYNNFLKAGNSMPLNSLWLVRMSKIPQPSQLIKTYKNDLCNDLTNTAEIFAAGMDVMRNMNMGILIAQAVSLEGDGNSVDRQGYENTPFPRGTLSTGRTPFKDLSIQFLETNISFVDYVIRPWITNSAHVGLTDSKFKTNITIEQLSKLDNMFNKNAGFVTRKKITYYNCTPISIDAQELNYTGGDCLMRRGVNFIYEYYKIQDIPNGDILNLPNVVAEYAIFNGDEAGKNSWIKNLAQKALDEAYQYGTSLANSALNQVYTSTVGKIVEAGTGLLNELKGAGWDAVGSVTGAINDAMNDALNNLLNMDVNKDTPNLEGPDGLGILGKDTPTFLKNKARTPKLNTTKINTNIPIKPNDIPTSIKPVLKTIGNNDVPIFKSTNNTDVDVNGVNKDTPMIGDAIPTYNQESVNDNDTPNYLSLSNVGNEKKINPDDVLQKHTNINEKNIDTDDVVSLNSIKTSDKSVSSKDYTTKPYKQSNDVLINQNDYRIVKSVENKDVQVLQNDDNPSVSLRVKTVSIEGKKDNLR